MSRFFSSLRSRLTILVLLAMLPALVLVIYLGLRQRQFGEWDVQDNAVRWAHQVSAQQRQSLAAARPLLLAMARMPLLREGLATACSEFLAEEKQRYPVYVNLSLVDQQGQLRCSAKPLGTNVQSVAHLAWFGQLLQTKDFTVGGYAPSWVDGQPVLQVAVPILEKPDKTVGGLLAELRLGAVEQVAADVELPRGASIYLCDLAGRMLALHNGRRGAPAPANLEPSVLAQMVASGSGYFKQQSFGAHGSLYGFVPVHTMPGVQAGWAVVEVPISAAYAPANRDLLMDLSPLVLVGLLVFTAIRLGGYRLLVKPVISLAAITERFAAGDWAARSGGPYGRSEVEQLRRSFDMMADSLTQRESQLKTSNRALKVISECNQRLVRATDEEELLNDICRIVVEHGGYRVAWVGYTEESAAGKRLTPRAVAGTGLDRLASLDLGCDQAAWEQGPTGQAVHTGQPQLIHQVASAPSFAPWRELAGQLGFASVLSLPLRGAGRVFGVLNIYSAESQAFDREEMSLLLEMAEDLAYGIMALRTQAEQQRAEERLQDSERRLRSVVEFSPMGMHFYEMDAQGRLILTGANRAADQILGIDHEPLVGRELLAAWPGLAGTEVPARYLEVCRRGMPWYNEHLVYRHGATVGAFEVHAFQTGPQRMVALFHSIAERLQAEERHRRLATAVEQAVEGFLITDAKGNIQYVNPALELMTGYRREELIGRSPRIFRSGKHDEEFYRDLWQTLMRGEVWRGFFFNRRKDGTVYQEEALISPIRDNGGEVTSYVAVKRDVTREIAMEIQLLQSQKMEAIGRLAGGLAHDFNNILTAITGYSELSLGKLRAGDPLQHNLEEIMKAADRATALTRQLLAFSRKQVLEPRRLDLNELVGNLEKMLRRLIGEDIELLTALAPGVWPVKADIGQIEQVIVNLTVNARDAMPLGGRVLIATTNTTIDAQAAERHLNLRAGDYVEITVSDTGVGMAEEVKAHLFEPFFTTKPNDKGTGLGLATCYGIIEQSGGHIEVHSQLGAGSSFHVYLPRLTADLLPPDIPPAGAVVIPRSRGNETVLLVEDEEAVRELSEFILSDLGYRVLSAGNGVEALELLKQRRPARLDLLATDVVMPQMGGRELAQRVRELDPNLRVLFCSGYTAESEWVSNALAQNTMFLQKPFSAAQLAQKVRELLDS